MTSTLVEQQIAALVALGVAETEVRTIVSPYRICPLGAHVDHQGGSMLGMAISACTVLAYAASTDGRVRLTSTDFAGAADFEIGAAAQRSGDWSDYARGAAAVLAPRIPSVPRGLVGVLRGTLPGGGLSSSASVILACLEALARINELSLRDEELVELTCAVENDHLGVRSGVLDPATIVGARRNAMLHIESTKLQWRAIPLGAGAPPHRFLVLSSGIDRALVATGFNDRVQECCDAAAALARAAGLPPAARLGDVPAAAFDRHVASLPAVLQRRARHYFGETARVAAGAESWQRGDLRSFGRLMHESGRSSIENYECGTPPMIELLSILQGTDGVLGARFSGAGFGGCCIALVAGDAVDEARAQIVRRFAQAHPELAQRVRAFAVDSVDGLHG